DDRDFVLTEAPGPAVHLDGDAAHLDELAGDALPRLQHEGGVGLGGGRERERDRNPEAAKAIRQSGHVSPLLVHARLPARTRPSVVRPKWLSVNELEADLQDGLSRVRTGRTAIMT